MVLIQNIKQAVTLVAALFFMTTCGQNKTTGTKTMTNDNLSSNKTEDVKVPASSAGPIDTATFGAGCFWCVEAVFQRLEGVISIKSGYAGGTVKNPSYK